MNKRIYLLAFVNFALGIAEMFPVGVLAQMARDMQVSLSLAGQLLGVFSLVFAVAAPVLQIATARWERRRVLLLAQALFIGGCLAAWQADSFAAQVWARVVQAGGGALMCGTAFALAAQIAAPEQRGRAIALAAMGISSAIVLGVPLGIWVAGHLGWHSMYALSAVLCVIGMIGVWFWLPSVPGSGAVPLRQQLRTLHSAKLLSAHGVTLLYMWGHFAAYAFLAPFMQQVVGLAAGAVSVLYLGFGLAGMCGGFLGGYGSDRFGGARAGTLAGCGMTLALLMLPLLGSAGWWAVLPPILLWAMSAWGSTPSIQHYLTSSAPETAGIQLGLNLAALNFGLALGAGSGGLALAWLSLQYIPWLGALVTIFGIGLLRWSARQPQHDKGQLCSVNSLPN